MEPSSIDWQMQCVNMAQRGAHLLETGVWSDCSFEVGKKPNQFVYHCHKLILSMASPVFADMLYADSADKSNLISILDVQPSAFKAILEFIYTNEINITSVDIACEMYCGAKKFKLSELVKRCTNFLKSHVNNKNACQLYEMACLFEENVLMERCLKIIITNTKEVLNDNSFLCIHPNTVLTIFSQEQLKVDSEIELLESAMRYVEARNKKESSLETETKNPKTLTYENVLESQKNAPEGESSQMSKPTDYSFIEHPDILKTKDGSDDPVIRKILGKIRFLTLTPQQFAKWGAKSPLLTESEAFSVLMNLVLENCDVPMPEGFSQRRRPRTHPLHHDWSFLTEDDYFASKLELN